VALSQLVSKTVPVPGNEESIVLWSGLDAPTQSAVKAELLKHLQEETEASILHKVCDAVSEIGSIVIDTNGWPELLPFMFACVQGANPLHRESALRIFAQVGTSAPQMMFSIASIASITPHFVSPGSKGSTHEGIPHHTKLDADSRERWNSRVSGRHFTSWCKAAPHTTTDYWV